MVWKLFNYIITTVVSFWHGIDWLSNNNPTLMHYYDDIDTNTDDVQTDVQSVQVPIIKPKYEDKYLDKFAVCPTDLFFSEQDVADELNVYTKLTTEIPNSRAEQVVTLRDEMSVLQHICDAYDAHEMKPLLAYLGEDDSDEDSDDSDDDSQLSRAKQVNQLREKIVTLQSSISQLQVPVLDADIHELAHKEISDQKLARHLNDYVMECTPLGNVYMRYNNELETFEYYSNASIPYRFLETVGRKYAITYNCKSIYVYMQEELDKGKSLLPQKPIITYSSNRTTNDNPSERYSGRTTGKKTPIQGIMGGKQVVKPTQTKTNVCKERANRYSRLGGLHDAPILKRYPKNLHNARKELSYSDFVRSRATN